MRDVCGFTIVVVSHYIYCRHCSGVINTVSAGGSLLTLPMLIFLGLPSSEANGTNRVAIVVQSITSVLAFKKRGKLETKVSSSWCCLQSLDPFLDRWQR
ncbi:sulfite exporter TauE/SafE family protein [Geomicrobium sp. JCM 19037]|uniref:TSUP family transporter n=1 Tax=Geomicrobium sp. JCM 19037 TaxID=1460634 RepID=UPI0009DF6021